MVVCVCFCCSAWKSSFFWGKAWKSIFYEFFIYCHQHFVYLHKLQVSLKCLTFYRLKGDLTACIWWKIADKSINSTEIHFNSLWSYILPYLIDRIHNFQSDLFPKLPNAMGVIELFYQPTKHAKLKSFWMLRKRMRPL